MRTLILYYSRSGHTLEAVNATAKGIRSAGSEAYIVSSKEFDGSLDRYDGVILASPCWAGSIGSGIPGPLKKVLKALPAGCMADKRGGAIAVHAAAGGNSTVASLGKILAEKGCGDVRTGPVAQAGTPLSIFKGPSVTTEDEARYAEYAAAFVA